MGVYVWKGPSGPCDFNDITNWDVAAVPGNGDVVEFPRGNSIINQNVNKSGTTFSRIFVGADFAGQIGADAANPFTIGNCNELRFDGKQCQGFFLAVATLAKAYILDGKADNYACYLQSGTITELDVYKAGLLRLGASLTVPTLNVSSRDNDGDARLEIMAGCAWTTCNQDGGYIVNRTAGGTLNLQGPGTFEHLGNETSGNLTAVLQTDGQFYYKAKKRVITTYEIRRGLLDCSQDPEDKTITTLKRWGRAKTILDNGTNRIKIVNDIVEMGFHMGGPGRNTTWAIPPIT